MAMVDEIIDTMLNTTKTLRPEDIDESKDYKLIHTTMQLKIKMKTDTIVDKLKARLCACGNELEEVESETYSPTVSNLTHSSMLQLFGNTDTTDDDAPYKSRRLVHETSRYAMEDKSD